MQQHQYWKWAENVNVEETHKKGLAGIEGMEHREHSPGRISGIGDADTGGNDVATRLYQQYAPSIFAYLRLHTPSREDAEDVLVDIFLAALENRYFALLPEAAQRAWLWRVARNKTVDAFRKHRLQRQHLPLDEFAGAVYSDEHFAPEQTALREEEYASLRHVISTLPEAQQQVLKLRFVSGLRCTEIATVLGRREGTVRSLLSRALNVLRNVSE